MSTGKILIDLNAIRVPHNCELMIRIASWSQLKGGTIIILTAQYQGRNESHKIDRILNEPTSVEKMRKIVNEMFSQLAEHIHDH